MGNLKVDKKALEALSKKLQQLENSSATDEFYEKCAKEMAARLLKLVIDKTLPGVYPNNPEKKGGTLRRGWTANKKQNSKTFAESLEVKKSGKGYTITIENNVEYAPYVEFGHRTRGGKSFVQGKHMLEISEQELESIAPKVLERKLNAFLKGALNG